MNDKTSPDQVVAGLDTGTDPRMFTASPATGKIADQWQGGEWNDLVNTADEIFGADLERGETLIGVPMCIIRLTYRQGDFTNAKTGTVPYYVSVDTIVGPHDQIARAERRGRIPEANRGLVEPGEHLVFNEGGTGVYRQTVEYLEGKNLIAIKSDLPREGAFGDSRLDTPPTDWSVSDACEFRVSPAGIPAIAFNVRILCPRGLRSSEYENEYTKSGLTRYIA